MQNESKPNTTTPPLRTRRLSVLMSPPKSKRRTSTPVTATSTNSVDTTPTSTAIATTTTNELQACDVCQVPGTAQDLVK